MIFKVFNSEICFPFCYSLFSSPHFLEKIFSFGKRGLENRLILLAFCGTFFAVSTWDSSDLCTLQESFARPSWRETLYFYFPIFRGYLMALIIVKVTFTL